MLLEFDPASPYEEVVKDFVEEQLTTGGPVFIFTSRGKPIYNSLLGIPNVRFFVMTGETAYPKPGQQPSEVLVPQDDSAVLLDLVERTLGSFVSSSWEKYKGMARNLRGEDPFLNEYFQWLAERISQRMAKNPRKPFHEIGA